MRRLFIPLSLVLLAIATATACGDDESDSKADNTTGSSATASSNSDTARAQATAPAKPPKKKPTGTTIKVRPSDFGDVIWDSKRQAIYLFDKEKGSKSECYGACAEAWPPVLTKGKPVAGSGVDKKLLGTTKRDDGKTQVTYGGHPLYYYEEPAGEITCQNVNEFGGLWLVVKPDGDPVR